MIAAYSYTSDDLGCTWTVESDGVIAGVRLRTIETADPTFEADCEEEIGDSGGIVCGVWSEAHDAFARAGANSYGGETWAITLSLLDSVTEQESNSSTLLK